MRRLTRVWGDETECFLFIDLYSAGEKWENNYWKWAVISESNTGHWSAIISGRSYWSSPWSEETFPLPGLEERERERERERGGSSLHLKGQKCGLAVFHLVLQPINKLAVDWDQSNSPHSTGPHQVSLVSSGQWRVRSMLRNTNTGLDLTEGLTWYFERATASPALPQHVITGRADESQSKLNN